MVGTMSEITVMIQSIARDMNGALWIISLPFSYFIIWLFLLPFQMVATRKLNRILEKVKVRRVQKSLITPLRLLFTLLIAGIPQVTLFPDVTADGLSDTFYRASIIAASVLIAYRTVRLIMEYTEQSVLAKTIDESHHRIIQTRYIIMRRVTGIFFWIFGLALIFIQFDTLRKFGLSILTSAGIAGVVIGFAAQKSIASLIAGIQLALTQPVRIGDSVVIDGEWGTIEEIHLTYVVVRIWDLRRLVVPINKFLDSSFQNWTRTSAELIGSVEIHMDYTVPVDKVRDELARIAGESKNWNGKVRSIQITDANPETIKLRALVSADNASAAWDLRCEVREKLIVFLQSLDGGKHLPRHRLDLDGKKD